MITIMSETLTTRLLELTQHQQHLAAGDVLFRAGDPVRSLFLVEVGAIKLSRPLPHGAPLTLQYARAGAILAEASLFAESYHCEAAAIEHACVHVISLQRLRKALLAQPDLSGAWIKYLAQEVQRTRAHAELLSLKTVAARVDAWMSLADRPLPPRGQWHQLAAEIGVTSEALYRELARRRRQ
jgi:CRP/FNR family transcriptional regulator, dissimilatory nitrate respiration regulator